MFCKYCGKELPDYANFCSQCGKKLGYQKNHVINEEMRDSLHFESYAFSLKDYVDIVRWR